jgi:hypothetical protein
MVALSKPDVILTHESDLDGWMAGFLCRRLAQHLFGAETPVHAYHNHSWKQRPMTERVAWVCDFTFETRVDKPLWLVIDHHPTNIQPRHSATSSAGRMGSPMLN